MFTDQSWNLYQWFCFLVTVLNHYGLEPSLHENHLNFFFAKSVLTNSFVMNRRYPYQYLVYIKLTPTENVFLLIILTANFWQVPLLKARRTSPHAPLIKHNKKWLIFIYFLHMVEIGDSFFHFFMTLDALTDTFHTMGNQFPTAFNSPSNNSRQNILLS